MTRVRYAAMGVVYLLLLIGGGGGIALFAGMSRLFSPLKYIAAVALAVAPVPVLFALGGWNL